MVTSFMNESFIHNKIYDYINIYVIGIARSNLNFILEHICKHLAKQWCRTIPTSAAGPVMSAIPTPTLY